MSGPTVSGASPIEDPARGGRRAPRRVAKVAGVTEVTNRNRSKELAERFDIGIVH